MHLQCLQYVSGHGHSDDPYRYGTCETSTRARRVGSPWRSAQGIMYVIYTLYKTRLFFCLREALGL